MEAVYALCSKRLWNYSAIPWPFWNPHTFIHLINEVNSTHIHFLWQEIHQVQQNFKSYKNVIKEQKFPFSASKIQEYVILAAVFVHEGPQESFTIYLLDSSRHDMRINADVEQEGW